LRYSGYSGTISFVSIDKTLKKNLAGENLSQQKTTGETGRSAERDLRLNTLAAIKQVFHSKPRDG